MRELKTDFLWFPGIVSLTWFPDGPTRFNRHNRDSCRPDVVGPLALVTFKNDDSVAASLVDSSREPVSDSQMS